MLKLAVLSFLCMYAYAAYYEDIAARTILEQNSNPHATWKAGYNTFLRGKSEDQIRRLMGARMDKKHHAKDVPEVSNVLANLPTSFQSGVDNWKQCAGIIGYIKDQADCGSCWAVSASEVVADRICIANVPSSADNDVLLNEPVPSIDMSSEDIMACCTTCGDGCGGGYPIDAMKWWKSNGVVTGGWYGSNCGCQPYQIVPCGAQGCSGPEAKTPKCSTSCRSGYPLSYTADKHKATNAYTIAGNAAAIQTEIYTNGPVQCAFNVYDNFMSYKSGVYTETKGQLLGGHAIKIIGWGVSGATPYWIINNSWNTTWGMNGVFWYLRGKNLGGMEAGCVAGTAATKDSNFNLQC